MHAQITEDMVGAAQAQLPGVWNRARVRRALEAALALIPAGDERDAAVTVAVHFLIDEQQMREAVAEAVEGASARIPLNTDGTLDLATLRAPIGQQPTMTITAPVPTPALPEPLELGSLAEFARRTGVARSTVSGWVKGRGGNGMPAPVHGDVYDLRALAGWHRAWKGIG